MRNALDFNLPPSISILINFGLYSKMIMYRYKGETGKKTILLLFWNKTLNHAGN